MTLISKNVSKSLVSGKRSKEFEMLANHPGEEVPHRYEVMRKIPSKFNDPFIDPCYLADSFVNSTQKGK